MANVAFKDEGSASDASDISIPSICVIFPINLALLARWRA
jgi:hypothetical protein